MTGDLCMKGGCIMVWKAVGVLAMLFVLCSGVGQALSPFAEAYGGSLNDGARSVAATADGGIVVAGYARQSTSSDAFVAKFDSSGAWVWSCRVPGQACGVVACMEGFPTQERIYVVGATAGGADFLVMKLRSSDGVSVWKKRWTHNGYNDRLTDLIVAQDGTIWAAGTSAGLGTWAPDKIVLAQIEPDGSALHCAFAGRTIYDVWSASLTEVFDPDGFCVVGTVDSTENDVVLAQFTPGPTYDDAWIIQADAGSTHYQENGTDILGTSDGELVVTGYSDDPYGGRSALLIKLRKPFNQWQLAWARIGSGTASSRKRLDSVVGTEKGPVALATVVRNGVTEVSLSQWSLTGTLLWNRIFDDHAYSAGYATAAQGEFLLTAGIASMGMGGDDICVARHNAWGHTCLDEIPGPQYTGWTPDVGSLLLGDSGSFDAPLSDYMLVPVYYAMSATPMCHPTALRVCPDGSGDYTTIQAALNAATSCDSLLLCDDEFVGQGNHDLDGLGKNVVVCSESGDSSACTVVLSGTQRGWNFHSGEDPTTVLEGIGIRGGSGGAIVGESSSPSVSNCWIRGCGAEGTGAVVWDGDPAVAITDCRIEDNAGSGVICAASAPELTNCRIAGNHEFGAVFSQGDPVLLGCTVSENATAGLSLSSSSPSLTNCTVAGNSGNGVECLYANPTLDRCIVSFNQGYGVYCHSSQPSSAPELSCCDVYGNSNGDWVGCISGQLPLRDNFSADPLYCGDYNSDPWTLSLESPCAARNNIACGLVGAWSIGCHHEGVVCEPEGRFLDDAYVSRTFGISPATTDEFTIRLRDGALRYLPFSSAQVCFMMDMEGIVWDTGGRPGIYYFGEVARYNVASGTLAGTVRVPDSWDENLGLAVQSQGFQTVYWYTRGGHAALFKMDESGTLLGSYPVFSDQITGLAMDPENDHLWCVARGTPDMLAEYDVTTAIPTLIQGPFAMPWASGPGGGGAAGLDYDATLSPVKWLVAIDARTGSKLNLRDNAPAYPGPPGGTEPRVARAAVCSTTETPEPWGIAVYGEETQAFVGSGRAEQPRPVDRYIQRAASAVDEDETLPIVRERLYLRALPNPSSPATMIQYELPTRGHVRLAVVDVTGREVATLVDTDQGPGRCVALWDASRVASGAYFCVLTTTRGSVTRKLVVSK
jgi:parallel beta-helix repeat protein